MTANEISKMYHRYNEFLIEKYSKIATCQDELLYLLEQDICRNSLLKVIVELEMRKTNATYSLQCDSNMVQLSHNQQTESLSCHIHQLVH